MVPFLTTDTGVRDSLKVILVGGEQEESGENVKNATVANAKKNQKKVVKQFELRGQKCMFKRGSKIDAQRTLAAYVKRIFIFLLVKLECTLKPTNRS